MGDVPMDGKPAPAPADPAPAAVPQADAGAAQTTQQFATLVVLLGLYSLVPLVALVDAAWQLYASAGPDGASIDTDGIVIFLGALAGSGKSILELIHKLILPLAGLFAGLNLGRFRAARLAGGLFLLPLGGLVASLVAALLFQTFSATQVSQEIPALFTDMASNLGIFVFLMIGLSAAGGAK